MVIFNSYVKLPEGKHNEMISIVFENMGETNRLQTCLSVCNEQCLFQPANATGKTPSYWPLANSDSMLVDWNPTRN